MPKVLNKRGTRAELNAAAAANQLSAGEVYLITDENRLAVGLTNSTYETTAKASEAGGGGATPVLLDISVVNGELIADYLAQLTPTLVDGELLVDTL